MNVGVLESESAGVKVYLHGGVCGCVTGIQIKVPKCVFAGEPDVTEMSKTQM